MSAHFTKGGRAVCGAGVPSEWPAGDVIASSGSSIQDTLNRITCVACRAILEDGLDNAGDPEAFFANALSQETRELQGRHFYLVVVVVLAILALFVCTPVGGALLDGLLKGAVAIEP